jgi:dTMP kinase
MAKKSLTPERRGIFITFEGPEGCGKSTQSALVRRYLEDAGYDHVHTREPGGTRLGERVRDVLLHSKGISISDLTELFLFEAARSQIVREVIAPALNKNKIVICDRFSDATLSYQGYGGRIPLAAIRALDRIATGGVTPDLTILLDVDTMTGLRRARRKGLDRMERKDIAYHKRVRAGYLKLAKGSPGRIRVIRVTGSIEETQSAVRREVERVIRRYKRAG